jgi:hypothetical protein
VSATTDKPKTDEGAVSATEALKANGGAAAVDEAASVKPGATPAVAAADQADPAALTAAALERAVSLKTAVSLPSDFEFGAVRPIPAAPPAPTPSLGPLAAFTGTFSGSGFNTIFRPDSTKTPTTLPKPIGGDNVLELNLTRETLSFGQPLGSVPNRGSGQQPDAFLNGVSYLQSISDVTGGSATGIHFEPGLWIAIPATTDPSEVMTVARMASIPHGTTINAQGTAQTFAGAPRIGSVSITPVVFNTTNQIHFPSQTATAQGTARIPQDLTSFIAAGSITQAILDDPNTVLRNHNAGLNIVSTTVIQITTNPSSPLFGGGTDNIAFLVGDAAANTNPGAGGQNAQAVLMSATFWINTVEHTIIIPPWRIGDPPLTLKPQSSGPAQLEPSFIVRPPIPITTPRTIIVRSTQIQYSQLVELVFNGLTWPHVSVASLVPSAPVSVPASAWQ